MAATYTPVTLAEMTELLKMEKGWHEVDLPRVREHVLDWRVKKFEGHIVVRVYTSVKKATGNGRACGRDAIRVCAVNIDTDRGLVKSKRVHRVENWRANLKARVTHVLAELDKQGHARRTTRLVPKGHTIDPMAIAYSHPDDYLDAPEPAVGVVMREDDHDFDALTRFDVGPMKPVPPNTSERLLAKLRRANEAEAAQRREPEGIACGGVAPEDRRPYDARRAVEDGKSSTPAPAHRRPRAQERKRPTLKKKYQR